MLEKSHITPSAVGIASARLAEVWKRTREIYRSAPYPEGSPELVELATLRERDVAITKTVPRRQRRGRLSRLTEDHLARMSRREEEGPSFNLQIRAYERAHSDLPRGTVHEMY